MNLIGHPLTDSRYEYVRLFEQPDTLLANTWIVVRIDGRGFSKYVCHFTLLFFLSNCAEIASCWFVIMQEPVAQEELGAHEAGHLGSLPEAFSVTV